ncbi:penicillin-binding transpeptidase domain-containing protein [Solibacillus sp. CAU 1738]|uniref:penicillin-binding transpeptidase domain-containing protein n=1 Tax=Solibacillus sp. CAU 1738 TaxID=3140363 RepID=UPI003260247F
MFLIYGGLFLLLFWRIVHIQTTGELKGYSLEAEAAARYAKEYNLSANRGRILDRNENIIAEDTLSYKMIAVVRKSVTTNADKPKHVVDPAKTARVLAEYIPMEEKDIYARLTKEGDPYQVEFGSAGRNISHEVMNAIKEEKLPGIIFVSDTKRYYPNGAFASHLIGFAQEEKQEDSTMKTVGKMGLEYTYNKQLTGVPGSLSYDSDRFGYLLPSSEKVIQPAKDGADIYLTLDKTIQNFLEESMTRVEEKYNPESMTAVVANPKTGEILAMSQRPTFDPDNRIGLESNWLNEAIEEVIEPGSTMKIFTLAAAIDSGNWYPNEKYQSGRYTILGSTINDHDPNGWGRISYLEGFQRSSNTAMAHLLEIMGADTFIDYLDKFGFGEKTGIDLPGEASGTILTKYPINKVTTAFGQGSTVTPIQLIQALTAIANDGQMMQPFVIDKIVDPNTGGIILDDGPIIKDNPISAETAKQVREILASTVTSEVGTARRFALDGYDVAGKTGTAQIPKEGGGYYWGKNQFLYSFLGMAPVDDPQLIMYIAIEKPKLAETESGSEPAAEIFKSVMENSLKYLNINPEQVAEVQTTKLPDYIGQASETVQVELINKGLTPVIIGEGGSVIEQYPKADLQVTNGSLVFLKTDGPITLPSFENWSLRNMLIYKTMSQLPIEIVGEGYVESQSVSANTVILDTSPIVVKLKTPAQIYAQEPEEVDAEEDQLPQD